jgi:hypothetical protein
LKLGKEGGEEGGETDGDEEGGLCLCVCVYVSDCLYQEVVCRGKDRHVQVHSPYMKKRKERNT